MIYVETSVVLAHLLGEDRRPEDGLWTMPLISSRLLLYETWVRLNARNLEASHGEAARRIFSQISLVDLSSEVLERALSVFPVKLRTLDALHLATYDFLRREKQVTSLATFDRRVEEAARRLRFPLTRI